MLKYFDQLFLALLTVYQLFVLADKGEPLIELLRSVLLDHMLAELSEVASVQIYHVLVILLLLIVNIPVS